MKTRLFLSVLGLLGLLLATDTAAARPLADPITTAFTYQGRLMDGGVPANGPIDFEFRLYDAASGGGLVGPLVTRGDVTVTEGLFTVQLDFGGYFTPAARYLDIAVRPGSSTGAYETLTPRQALTAAPFALYALQSNGADMLDSYHAGNFSGNLPVSNGSLNSSLNADMLDGLHASSFALGTHNHWGQTWSGAPDGTGLIVNGGNVGLQGFGDSHGVYAYGDSFAGLWAVGVNAVYAEGFPTAGYFDGNVTVVHNFAVYGTKAAVVNTQNYGARKLYAVESPESWFEDFGTGQLQDGAVVITIEPIFAQTVNLQADYHVFVTPTGDCALYVDEKSPTSFSVRALGGQTCSIPFDYRIVAKRLGYENVRLEEGEVQPEAPAGER